MPNQTKTGRIIRAIEALNGRNNRAAQQHFMKLDASEQANVLIELCIERKLYIAQILLTKDNILLANKFGETCLSTSVDNEQVESVNLLLELAKEWKINIVNSENLEGITPLLFAIQRQNYIIINALLQEEDINLQPLEKLMELPEEKFDEKIIGKVLEKANSIVKNSLFLSACEYGSPKKLKFILKYQPDCNTLKEDASNALHMAAYNSDLDIVKIVLNYFAKNKVDIKQKINEQNKLGGTPAIAVIESKFDPNSEEVKLEILKLLMDNGADNIKAEDFTSLLSAAAVRDYAKIVQFLLERSDIEPDINDLIVAIERQSIKSIKLLLQDKRIRESINKENFAGKTALSQACSLRIGPHTSEIISLILEITNIDVEQLVYDFPPIVIAYHHANLEAVRQLINKKQVKLNTHGADKNNLLHIACHRQDEHMVEFIISNNNKIKININAQNTFGYSALHFAVMHKKQKIIERLLSQKVIIDLCDVNGNTPVGLAISSQNQDIINLFLNYKDRDTSSKDGKTLLMLTIDQLYKEGGF